MMIKSEPIKGSQSVDIYKMSAPLTFLKLIIQLVKPCTLVVEDVRALS